MALLAAVYVALVVFPAPLFSHAETFGRYRVYSDEPIPEGFGAVLADLDRRVEAMEHAPHWQRQRIFLCGPGRYALFAFLLRRSPGSLAIGLSAANESFVSRSRLELFAARNRGVLRHTRFEGSVAGAVAHEIAHFHSLRALGYRAHRSQPLWKSEGWAEYQANRAALRADPDYDLVRRVEQLRDDDWWAERPRLARRFWEYQLLVEYLGEVEGYRLGDLAQEDVTLPEARRRLAAWVEAQAAGRPGR